MSHASANRPADHSPAILRAVLPGMIWYLIDASRKKFREPLNPTPRELELRNDADRALSREILALLRTNQRMMRRSPYRFHTFISYTTREDETYNLRDFVRRLERLLNDNGLPTQQSPVFHDGIFDVGGRNLKRNLKGALYNSAIVANFLSPKYFDSPFCVLELTHAVNCQKAQPFIWKPLERLKVPKWPNYFHDREVDLTSYKVESDDQRSWRYQTALEVAIHRILISGLDRLRLREASPDLERHEPDAG